MQTIILNNWNNIYEIAEKSPQKQFEGNTTVGAVITL
jgi:hypothetical protein